MELRRLGARLLLGVAMSVAAGAALAHAPAAVAYNNDFGALRVLQPCCGGASLQGSRATIRDPYFPVQILAGQLAATTVAAENNANNVGGGLIQIGIEKNNGIAAASPECNVNSIHYFVESYDPINFSRCVFIGYASEYTSVTHKYSVQRQLPSLNYQAFLDGVAPKGMVITAQPSSTGNVGLVQAGGEVVYNTSFSGAWWDAFYAGAGNTPWQRYNDTLGWVTINTPTNVCKGSPGLNCSGATGWGVNTANFPTDWNVSHS
jgi:hypothetical protein